MEKFQKNETFEENKAFNEWNEVKKEIDFHKKRKYFKQGQIYFVSVGQNIGYEIYGKGEEFLRPVLVFRKLSKDMFIGIPLTSNKKDGYFYYTFSYKNDKLSTALLSQIRNFDAKRIKYYSGTIDRYTFLEIEKKVADIFKFTLPNGGGYTHQNSEQRNNTEIIPQKTQKIILFDMDMPKWVLFFNPIIKRLKELNHKVIIVSRGGDDYSELNRVLDLYNLEYISVGEYGGASLEGKLKASIDRQTKLMEIIKKYNINVVVSGSVVDINRVAFGVGLKIVNFNDMPIKNCVSECEKVTPVTRLTAPFSSILFKPFMVDNEIFEKLGVCKTRIKNYNFIDPLIWLKNFKIDENYVKKELPFIDEKKPIVVIREEEFKASYVQNQYPFLYEVIEELQNWDINLIIIPRYEAKPIQEKFKKAIVLQKAIILQNLLAKSSLFIGGGGTINIEACYFGVPVISTRSFISHYDKFLIDNELMWHSNNTKEIINLAKKLLKQNTKQKSKEIFSQMEVDIEMFVKEIV